MKGNTIVTIGDVNYLWGIFMLIASARKAAMDEPFLVGCRAFTPEAERILTQLGGVSLVPLDRVSRSLTCYKAHVMLDARTEFVTWADSDAFFTGNVSELLLPESNGEIHFRLRAPAELPGILWRRKFGCDGTEVPPQVLDVWRRDVAEIAGRAVDEPRFRTAGSACFCSLSIARFREFLKVWHELQMKVLPEKDVGVADRSLLYYPQLDESTLNACLMFMEDAPGVQRTFRMDKDRSRLFVHFIAQPKPWMGWTSRAFRFFDEYVSVLDWASAQGYERPGKVPACLKASNKRLMKALIPWMTLKPKIVKRLRRVFG